MLSQSASIASEEDEVTKLTEEQRLQKRLDEQNIIMQLVMQGDKENFPVSHVQSVYAIVQYLQNVYKCTNHSFLCLDYRRYRESQVCLYSGQHRQGREIAFTE